MQEVAFVAIRACLPGEYVVAYAVCDLSVRSANELLLLIVSGLSGVDTVFMFFVPYRFSSILCC